MESTNIQDSSCDDTKKMARNYGDLTLTLEGWLQHPRTAMRGATEENIMVSESVMGLRVCHKLITRSN